VFEIVKRNELHKFVVLPKRWIVERTLAWISRNRRLACDFDRYARTAAAFVKLAMIRIMPDNLFNVNRNFLDRLLGGAPQSVAHRPRTRIGAWLRTARGRVLVHPDENPPIIADDQDPDFLHAIIEGDDGAIPDTNLADLTAWRGFVLNDGPVPPQGVRRRRPRQ